MDPGRGPTYLWDTPPDDRPHLIRTLKLLQQKQGPSQLERSVRIRADRARDIVLLCKRLRLTVELRRPTTRVEHFNRIHLWQDCQQVGLLPVAATMNVKWMGYADESPLVSQAANGLLR